MDMNLVLQNRQADTEDGQSMLQTEPLTFCGGKERLVGEEEHPISKRLRASLLPKEAKREDQFLPESDLEQILSTETIGRFLKEAVTRDGDVLKTVNVERDILPVETSDYRRVKILAVLILIEKPAFIVHFIHRKAWDTNLPLASNHEIFKDADHGRFTDDFCLWQWAVLAPCLDFTGMEHCIVEPQVRMPFLDHLEWTKSRQGAHGRVLKTSIHDDYQKRRYSSTQDSYPFYAIKLFKFEDKNDSFEQERGALARFSGEGKTHPNLIELLFSYERGVDKYLIFPWAKWDLEHFWKSERRDPPSSKNFIWLLRQCYGLADGLCQVHVHGPADRDDTDKDEEDWNSEVDKKLEGRHGDIKPQNILFFEDSQKTGRFVIADFTLMRFHAPNATVTDANAVGFSRTYRPPEVDGKDGIGATHKYDVWTLGCVYLEFVTWHLLGYDAIHEKSFRMAETDYESFSTARQRDDDKKSARSVEDKFFNLNDENGAAVKDSVQQWIAFLKNHQHASPGLRAFLDMVLKRMLVTHPKNRRNMKKLLVEFGTIISKCDSCAEYSMPGHRNPEEVIPVTYFPQPFTKHSRYGKVDTTPLRDVSPILNSQSRSDIKLIKKLLGPQNGTPSNTLTGHEAPHRNDTEDGNPSGLGSKSLAEASTPRLRVTRPGKRSSFSLHAHLDEADSRLNALSRQESEVIATPDSTKSVIPRVSLDWKTGQPIVASADELSKKSRGNSEEKKRPSIEPQPDGKLTWRRGKRLLSSSREHLEAWWKRVEEICRRLR